MRKIVLLFLLFMAVPAMAVSTVTITCSKTVVGDTNWVTVSYSSDTNRIRAFGLDINVAPADGNIMDVNVLDPCGTKYRIYPGRINFVNGDVNTYGTPYDPCDLADHNNVLVVEMGSLYTLDANYASDQNSGYNKIPGKSGALLKFAYKNATCYTVDVNARRGGIVMEDAYETPSISSPLCSCGNIPPCTVPDVNCMTPTNACAAIVANNLVCGTSQGTEVKCACANGNVTRTDPPAGTSIPCGTTVNYWVAANPAAPGAASGPTPSAGATCVSQTQDLSWTVGSNTSTQDVYFGTSNPPPKVVSDANAATTTYDTGTMSVYTLYRWRIDEKNACGTTTTGTVYCFTTGPNAGKPCCNNEAHVCLGDVNTVAPYYMTSDGRGGDNYVRATDLTALAAFINTLGSSHRCSTVAGSGTCPPCYDFDGDGYVRATDLTTLAAKINTFGTSHRHTCPYVSCSNP